MTHRLIHVTKPENAGESEWKTNVGGFKPVTAQEEIIAHMESLFGPSIPSSCMLYMDDRPIQVNMIPATLDRPFVTFFTLGMSRKDMKMPGNLLGFEHAEMFIQLPGDWPISPLGLVLPNYGWIVNKVPEIGEFLHQSGNYIAPPVSMMSNEEPPQPYVKDLRFNAMLFVHREETMPRSDGKTVHFYRLLPLYPEERDRYLEGGPPALLTGFHQHNVGFVVDLDRDNSAGD